MQLIKFKKFMLRSVSSFLLFIFGFFFFSKVAFAADNDAVKFDGVITCGLYGSTAVAAFQSGVNSMDKGIVMASYKGNFGVEFNLNMKGGYIYYGKVYQFIDVKLMSQHSGLLSTSANGHPNINIVNIQTPEGITASVKNMVSPLGDTARISVALEFDEYIPANKQPNILINLSIESSLIFDQNYMGVDKEYLSYAISKYGSVNTNGLTQNKSDTIQSLGWKGKVTKQLTWIRDTIEVGFTDFQLSMEDVLSQIHDKIQGQTDAIGNEFAYQNRMIKQQTNAIDNNTNVVGSKIDNQTTTIKNQTDSIMNGYSNDGMGQSQDKLDSNLDSLDQAEQGLFGVTGQGLDNLDLSDFSLDAFGISLISGLSFTGNMIQAIYVNSLGLSGFGVVINVALVLVLVCALIGLYRYFK